MARAPMVSRTITTTKVNALCMDMTNTEPFNKTVILPRTYKDKAKLAKALTAVINDENTRFVDAVFTEEVETLYGMSEQDFIDNAKVLDKETRKPIEQ